MFTVTMLWMERRSHACRDSRTTLHNVEHNCSATHPTTLFNGNTMACINSMTKGQSAHIITTTIIMSPCHKHDWQFLSKQPLEHSHRRGMCLCVKDKATNNKKTCIVVPRKSSTGRRLQHTPGLASGKMKYIKEQIHQIQN